MSTITAKTANPTETVNSTSTSMAGINVTRKVWRYEFNDVVRGKGVLIYALFFFALTEALIQFSGGAKALVSIMNVALIMVPLVSVLFGTMYLYNSRNFITTMLVQPISRQSMFMGLYLGLAVPVAAAAVLGIGIPFLIHAEALQGNVQSLQMLLLSVAFLSFIFVALAFIIFVYNDDRVRGFSLALLVWFFSGVIYDGLILLVVQAYQMYPLEIPTLVLTVLNPIDLARVMLMLSFDIAAMMGYTGAIFEAFFGSIKGLIIALMAMSIWVGVPLWISYKAFLKKDF